VLRNPTRTLAIVESSTHPSQAVFAAELGGRWYTIESRQEGDEETRYWNREAFELLSQLYQMTVTDVARVPTLPITIAK